MANGLATMTRPRSRDRLSPKVRRMLRDHQLDPGRVDGTGTRGRITPDDVERTVRGDGVVRASPLARRLLREAGLPLQDAPTTGPITRAVADRMIARDGADDAGTERPGATASVQVDLSRVLYGVGGAREQVRRRSGVELTPAAVLAHAVCRSLRRNPALHSPGSAVHRDVDLSFVLTADQGSVVRVVPCAQDLTVTALAARTAHLRDDDAGAPDATFAIVGDGWGATPPVRADQLPAAIGVLTVDAAQQRPLTSTDEFGGETTATRWVTTLRLTHDDAVDDAHAAAFLDDLKRELETVDLLAAVA